ncbi:MAG: hypothetical protein FIA89_00660 [Geobacter sp.]|nr:hypothetical protein [Geobacter sp.]
MYVFFIVIFLFLFLSFNSSLFVYAEEPIKYRHPVKEDEQTLFSYLIKANPDNDAIIHEVFPEGVFDAIIEDVIFLLPLDLVKAIAGDSASFSRLISKSKFYHKNDYWLRMIYGQFDKESLDLKLSLLLKVVETYSNADIAKLNKDERRYITNLLIDAYAESIKYLVEFVNSTPKDPTGDLMSFRMSQFMKERNSNYVIRYSGYTDISIPDLLDKLVLLRESKVYNDLFYVATVTAIADIWSTVWKNAGNDKYMVPPQVFLVKSADLNMKAILDLSAKIKDYKEWDLVARRDHHVRRTEFVADLVEKRIDDYVSASSAESVGRGQ